MFYEMVQIEGKKINLHPKQRTFNVHEKIHTVKNSNCLGYTVYIHILGFLSTQLSLLLHVRKIDINQSKNIQRKLT